MQTSTVECQLKSDIIYKFQILYGEQIECDISASIGDKPWLYVYLGRVNFDNCSYVNTPQIEFIPGEVVDKARELLLTVSKPTV